MKPGKCSLGTRFTEEKNAPLPEQGGQARDHFDASPVWKFGLPANTDRQKPLSLSTTQLRQN